MESLWIKTTKDEINLKSLESDEETEVCVIGAGLFGLTTAYYLMWKESCSFRKRWNRKKSKW